MNQKGFAPILIIVLIAVAILGGFLVYQQNKLISLSNWKVYRNKDYGYEVSYPPNYLLTEKPNGAITIGSKQLNKVERDVYVLFGVDVLVNNEGNKPWPSLKQYDRESRYEDITVNGLKGIKVTSYHSGLLGGFPNHIIAIYLEKPNDKQSLYRIYYQWPDEDGVMAKMTKEELQNLEMFNQILSTFRFLE